MSFAFGFLLTGSLETSTPDDASCPAYNKGGNKRAGRVAQRKREEGGRREEEGRGGLRGGLIGGLAPFSAFVQQ